MKDCIFCKISRGEIPAPKLAENECAFIIKDIQPQAKLHYLVIPNVHVATLDEAFADENQGKELVGNLFALGLDFAREQGLLPGGFRSVINTNADGGQTVFHVHLHLLGGEKLKGTFA